MFIMCRLDIFSLYNAYFSSYLTRKKYGTIHMNKFYEHVDIEDSQEGEGVSDP